MVNPPTLPKNINIISIARDATLKLGVIPKVNPTVPNADAVSNIHCVIGSFSIALIIALHTANIPI